jgi:ribonuclease P protein component
MAILGAERAGCERIRNANAVDDSVSDTPKGSFPKRAHLRKHSDFQRVYQQGRRHFSGNMTVFYLPAVAGPAPNQAGAATEPCARAEARVRIGFTVSKALGGSVERNRMRRRAREAVRHHLLMLEGMSSAVDVVINPKKSLLTAEFPQISQEIERAFGVIRQSCEAGGTKSARREARRR